MWLPQFQFSPQSQSLASLQSSLLSQNSQHPEQAHCQPPVEQRPDSGVHVCYLDDQRLYTRVQTEIHLWVQREEDNEEV
ncbi:hypothetical protein INR49_024696 [Caranx melampygus]|nr:hypothetical protein INR49_024696 [Caranx melampygus]